MNQVPVSLALTTLRCLRTERLQSPLGCNRNIKRHLKGHQALGAATAQSKQDKHKTVMYDESTVIAPLECLWL